MYSSTIEQDRRFYEEALEPMIKAEFPEFEHRIAAGIAGEGSDCFGYDDEISRDHDFGIGVCLWLTEDDFAKIGRQLQTAYHDTLMNWRFEQVRKGSGIDGFEGSPEELSSRLDQRRGVQTIQHFYQANLGFVIDPASPALSGGMWFFTDEWRFAAAANGEVFRDDLGQFSRIREILCGYYPEKIWRMRLTNALHEYAAAMQANYARCMARGDTVAASYCKMRSIDAAMDIIFLLRRRFAPYYKWKFRAFRELEGSGEIAGLLEKAALLTPDAGAWAEYDYDAHRVNTQDRLVVLFEDIAALLIVELRRAGLSKSDEVFLEAHCADISAGIDR